MPGPLAVEGNGLPIRFDLKEGASDVEVSDALSEFGARDRMNLLRCPQEQGRHPTRGIARADLDGPAFRCRKACPVQDFGKFVPGEGEVPVVTGTGFTERVILVGEEWGLAPTGRGGRFRPLPDAVGPFRDAATTTVKKG